MTTLVEQLEAAEQPLERLGFASSLMQQALHSSTKAQVDRSRNYILESFLERDYIASQVSNGFNHYSDLAKSVADRYSGFWKKTSAPKLDTEFDLRLEEPIHSMNSVGVVPPIDSLQFMTSRRALDLKGSYKSGIIGSGLIVLVTAGVYCIGVKEAKDFSPYVPLAFIIGIPLLGHLGARFFQYFSMSKSISNLESAASTTEKYLEKLV